MLLSLILGAVAGCAVPHAEPHVKTAMEKLFKDGSDISATELKLVSFAACLFAAAIVVSLGDRTHAAALVLGGALGILAPRLIALWKTSRAPDYDS